MLGRLLSGVVGGRRARSCRSRDRRDAMPNPVSRTASTSTIEAQVEQLDLATMIEVSQALSGEMVLGKLIDKLMLIALERAGAERGLLLIPRGDELRIEAEAITSGEKIKIYLPEGVDIAAVLPESLARYVMRTHESVILDDASSRNQFSGDPYIVQCRARSIL